MIDRTLWFLEKHLAEPLTLESIAAAVGASPFHLTRAFGQATGRSLMRYVRERRLAKAAAALAAGAPDILRVALDHGYGSHEAFTRAFRERFGVTPDAFRTNPIPADHPPLEPLNMQADLLDSLDPPRLVDAPAMNFAGLVDRYTFETLGRIPSQWERFAPRLGTIPGQVGAVAYGVCFNGDDSGLDYLAAVEVRAFDPLPADLARLRVGPQRYAVFSHAGHVSDIRRVWTTIYQRGLDAGGLEPADAASYERYGERFDGRTGHGGFEIWIPVKGP